jgi:hypothetical protein
MKGEAMSAKKGKSEKKGKTVKRATRRLTRNTTDLLYDMADLVDGFFWAHRGIASDEVILSALTALSGPLYSIREVCLEHQIDPDVPDEEIINSMLGEIRRSLLSYMEFRNRDKE